MVFEEEVSECEVEDDAESAEDAEAEGVEDAKK